MEASPEAARQRKSIFRRNIYLALHRENETAKKLRKNVIQRISLERLSCATVAPPTCAKLVLVISCFAFSQQDELPFSYLARGITRFTIRCFVSCLNFIISRLVVTASNKARCKAVSNNKPDRCLVADGYDRWLCVDDCSVDENNRRVRC